MRLGVNIDHVATLREARKTTEPDPVTAAMLAEMGGADQVTFHLREDRRHIQNRDARLICEMAQTKVNLEMAATLEMQEIALAMRPDSVTLVPEKREEVTTEGGLNLLREGEKYAATVKALKDGGIRTAAFIGPDQAQVKEAAKLGFDAIEIHTGEYANAARRGPGDTLRAVQDAATAGRRYRLRVHAGHGLTYHNVHPVVQIPEIEELNIGHSIISRAVFVGMEQAVAEMVSLMIR
ncbi:MAG TPA: pyridoxine 5'-phosphate synthase [Candidatus Eisenbacteria bacterium]|uniref:Pyridoxine 5'-phosphate synthase n=1 Tax=Eiseniibacteriota bacterium TaxID=2212470 RepID=A0A7V2AV20_UNCEI|nr:pyridoxine 5'-phosphate synthase [Candidatus Eisenbacteria bacterium]